jgi:hypothetical protein
MKHYCGQKKAAPRTAAFCKIVKSKLISIIFTAALLSLAESGFAQGFVNLDFEHPILPLSPTFSTVSAANAIPGWTASFGGGDPLSYIGYDTVSLGGSAIFLEDTNAQGGGRDGFSNLPIQGNYSVLLEGSAYLSDPLAASIGQTGTIPVTAQSLTFFGILAGNLQVTFNGQPLSFMSISNALNYTIWGADISAYAGQTGQLLFTAPVLNAALLDNIKFSSLPIPEPSAFALATLGALLLGLRRRHR